MPDKLSVSRRQLLAAGTATLGAGCLPGVSEAMILGEADYSMRLWLNPDRMAIYSLSVSEVYAALREQNVQVAAGKVGAPPFDGPLQAEFSLQTAFNLACQHQAKAWELRSAISLARFWHGQNRFQQAYDVLFPVYSEFKESSDTTDIRNARSLLNALTH